MNKTINYLLSTFNKNVRDQFSYVDSRWLKVDSYPRGFTLIELLISIAIIGILSSVVIVNLGGFRERGRDTQRKSDILQIQTALELYRADQASYPTTNNFPNCTAANASLVGGTTVYMAKVPCDPLPAAAWGRQYNYSSTGNAYTLFACLENGNDPKADTSTQNGCAAAEASFTVTSP